MSYRRLLLFIAIFLAAFGRLDLFDLNFGYLSVLPDLFGQFRDRQTLGKKEVLHLSNSQSFRVLEGSRCSRETVAVVIRRMATSTFIQLRRHMAGVER